MQMINRKSLIPGKRFEISPCTNRLYDMATSPDSKTPDRGFYLVCNEIDTEPGRTKAVLKIDAFKGEVECQLSREFSDGHYHGPYRLGADKLVAIIEGKEVPIENKHQFGALIRKYENVSLPGIEM